MHSDKVKINDAELELRVDPSLAASVLRAFAGRTPKDQEIDSLEVPPRPLWLNICIRFLRQYRKIRPISIGQRCVFDPSCSRYSELAFRQYGFRKGFVMTFQRLHRCRPSSGGVDVP